MSLAQQGQGAEDPGCAVQPHWKQVSACSDGRRGSVQARRAGPEQDLQLLQLSPSRNLSTFILRERTRPWAQLPPRQGEVER